MTENERFEERMVSIKLRALLGEENFWQIANVNPERYLGYPPPDGGGHVVTQTFPARDPSGRFRGDEELSQPRIHVPPG